MASDEFDIIRRHFNRDGLAFSRTGVALGIGDDCALLTPQPGQQLAMSMDMLQEGVHFLPNSDPYLLGQRTLLVNLSDLAAMGAKPLCFTLGLSLPSRDEKWLERFSAGLAEVAQAHDCPLVGGDLTATHSQRGAMTFCVQVHGEVPEGRAIKRSGAKAGDLIYVTGTLGDAAAGLAVLQGLSAVSLSERQRSSLVAAFCQPTSRVAAGIALRDVVTTAIDLSDGMASDIEHILRASDVGATIEVQNLPLSDAFCAMIPEADRLTLALGGGDDYELCFTLAPEAIDEMETRLRTLAVQVTCIGRIERDPGLRWQRNNKLLTLEIAGYNHFPAKNGGAGKGAQ